VKQSARSILATALASTLSLAASACSDDGLPIEGVDSIEQNAFIADTLAWARTGTAPASIPVCWETAGFATEKGWSRTVIEARFENQPFFHVDFTGFGQCTPTSQGVRIRILDEAAAPHVVVLGNSLNARVNGMVLNFTFLNWNNSSSGNYCHDTEAGRKDCIERIAMHEFGHALGMSHENNRLDKPSTCDDAPQGPDGTVFVGNFDYFSLMSYCPNDQAHWNGGGNLSETDKAGLSRMYGNGGVVYVGVTGTSSTFPIDSGFPRAEGVCQLGTTGETCMTADVNGDGKDDLLRLKHTGGQVLVQLGTATGGFSAATQWHPNLYNWGPDYVVVGDFTGDGRADIAKLQQENGDVLVAPSLLNNTFGPPVKWHDTFAAILGSTYAGDFNGDNKLDLVAIAVDGSNTVRVALSNGTSFTTNSVWHSSFCANGYRSVGDVNHDNKDDLVCFDRATGDVRVNLSSGTSFAAGIGALWYTRFCFPNSSEIPTVADIDNDGFADIVKFNLGTGGFIYTAVSNGAKFTNYAWAADGQCMQNDECWMADITGGGKADVLSLKR